MKKSKPLMTRDQCKASSSSCCCCYYWCNHNFHITSQGQQHDCWAPFKIESNVRKKKERNKTRSFRAVREGDQSRELTPLRPQEIWLLRRLKGSSAALSLSGGVEGTTKAKGLFYKRRETNNAYNLINRETEEKEKQKAFLFSLFSLSLSVWLLRLSVCVW